MPSVVTVTGFTGNDGCDAPSGGFCGIGAPAGCIRLTSSSTCGAPIMVTSARAVFTAQAGLPEEYYYADALTSEADKDGG